MVQLGILLLAQHRLLSIAAILDVFETVNVFYKQNNKPPAFNINLYYTGTENVETITFGRYQPEPISKARNLELVLIPAFCTEDLQTAIKDNYECLPWLREQYHQGAQLASFCTGAFLLAASGLLDGKQATTHINAARNLADFFPKICVTPEAVVTQDEGIYTSGGATSTFHLLLHLLQQYCGRDITLRVAKFFAIDMDRGQQTHFGTFNSRYDHGDELVTMVQDRIEGAFKEAGSIEHIIQDIPASRRNVVRRFKMATGTTPIEYLQKTRVEAAKKILEQTSNSIMEVMLDSGYNDLKSFRQIFKKMAGMTPTAYREKFRMQRTQTA